MPRRLPCIVQTRHGPPFGSWPPPGRICPARWGCERPVFSADRITVADQLARLMKQVHGAPDAACSISLTDNAVTGPDGESYPFKLDAVRRDLLLARADDIAVTLQMKDQIKRFQECQRLTSPWLE